MLLESTVPFIAAASSSIAVSAPAISDVVSPSGTSTSDAISAAESLILLHNVVSPKIKSSAGNANQPLVMIP